MNLTTTMENLNSAFKTVKDNVKHYSNKVLNKLSSEQESPTLTESVKHPILGYDTGEQGWYDFLGGGPCNKYCRYTGISPNIQWTCSDENDLSTLTPTAKSESGRFCYGYDKKTLYPAKTGAIVNGTFTQMGHIGNSVANGNLSCEELCLQNPNCQSYVEDNKTKSCWLKLKNNDNIIENFEIMDNQSLYIMCLIVLISIFIIMINK
jgi:hypothetical protein